jgi:hypothetical protein
LRGFRQALYREWAHGEYEEWSAIFAVDDAS